MLANCQKLTNKCIQTLGQFKHLRVLDISGCIDIDITNCGIGELPVTLLELGLARLEITATGMQPGAIAMGATLLGAFREPYPITTAAACAAEQRKWAVRYPTLRKPSNVC